jgi:plasmid stabilization system protein ParE
MTRWFLAVEAADDLDRLTDFLLETSPNAAFMTVDLILDGLEILSRHPRIGRIAGQGLRELVISRARSGYVALYSYDEAADVALVLAVRQQREEDFN